MGLNITETVVVEAVFHNAVSAAHIHDWLACIERLIERQQPFFFISSTLVRTELANDYRAIQAAWYKRHKPAFRRLCLGLVRIANDAGERARLDTPALQAAWGVPYFVTLERLRGFQWIAERMVSDATGQ